MSRRPSACSACCGSKAFSIDVVDFLINDLDFPDAFTEAIERKQVATQDALAARQRVEQSKAEAQQEDRAGARPGGGAAAARAGVDGGEPQFEALQIFKEHPLEITFLAAGQGNLLDPSTFLRTRPLNSGGG